MNLLPTIDDAFQRLEARHTAERRWEALIELYLSRLEICNRGRHANPQYMRERVELLHKIARVFDEQLDDKPQALDALLNALSLDIQDNKTTRYLERMARATGRWSEVIQAVFGWLTHLADPKKRFCLLVLLTKWYREEEIENVQFGNSAHSRRIVWAANYRRSRHRLAWCSILECIGMRLKFRTALRVQPFESPSVRAQTRSHALVIRVCTSRINALALGRQDVGSYDVGSLMHYGSFAFSKNKKATLTRLDGTTFERSERA